MATLTLAPNGRSEVRPDTALMDRAETGHPGKLGRPKLYGWALRMVLYIWKNQDRINERGAGSITLHYGDENVVGVLQEKLPAMKNSQVLTALDPDVVL